MITLKCQCCGFEQDFLDGEEAFEAGWDAPPHFTTHVCCKICPAVCVVFGASHAKAHANWETYGRPKEWGPRCVDDKNWGVTQQELEEQAEGIRKIITEFKP